MRRFLALVLALLLLLPMSATAGKTWLEQEYNHAYTQEPRGTNRTFKSVLLYPVREAKAMVHDRNFLLGMALLAAAQFADGRTTVSMLQHPGTHEQNPLLGRHPSSLRVYGEGAGLFTLQVFGYWELKRANSPIFYSVLGGQITTHALLAKRNSIF